MKYLSALIFFVLLSLGAHSQSKNTISLVYGVAGTITATTGNYPISEGNTSPFTVKSGMRIGVMYDYRLSNAFSIGGSVLFNPVKAQYTYVYAADVPYVQNGHINMASLQVMGKYHFLKYLFIDAGLSADSQLSQNVYRQIYDQSGLGIEAGLGAAVTTGHVTFAVNPFWHDHLTGIIFHVDSNEQLTDAGVKFSVGYSF